MQDANLTPGNEPAVTPKRSRFPWRLAILITLSLVAVFCIAGAIVVFGSIRIQSGGYSVDQVILTNDLDKNGRPVGSQNTFQPSERIFCSVITKGADGIIGMRWYYGDKLIFERFGRTQNNIISMYIQSGKTATLEEGDYRVDIHLATTDKTPLKTVHFAVKRYMPEVQPSIPTPTSHHSLEKPIYTEVPFAFDEVWKIGDTNWSINEVKVVMMDTGETLVAVVVKTDAKDLLSLTEEQAKERAKPIALYALQNGYLERARSLQIDGKSYALDKQLFVNMIRESDLTGYRVLFDMNELLR